MHRTDRYHLKIGISRYSDLKTRQFSAEHRGEMSGVNLVFSLLFLIWLLGTSASEDDFVSFGSSTGFVNCEHARRMLKLDSTQFELGALLRRCWYKGVTLDEIDSGIRIADDRQDHENYSFDDFYLSCDDMFGSQLVKLTTTLVQDFAACENTSALHSQIHRDVYRRFGDILDVHKLGNASISIDQETLFSCHGTSKSILDVCREYGLTKNQIEQGFIRYYHNDKWVVEEEVTSLFLTCDRVFADKLEKIAYAKPVAAFLKCLESTPMDSRVRDAFEKDNAAELQAYREQYTPERPFVDLRGYVSCRNLRPVRVRNSLVSPSLRGLERCRSVGVRYENLLLGDLDGSDIERDTGLDLDELYVECSLIFDEDLYCFSTELLKDFEACKKAGKIPTETRRAVHKKFADLFGLLTDKSKRVPLKPNLLEHLVRCSNFTEHLANLCREHGSTVAQELRGIGSFAQALGDHWLNAEDLDKLYVRCNDLFGDLEVYRSELEQLPIEQYMQCRWIDQVSDEGKKFIDNRIASVYENKHKWNGTRYIGDADVEISSLILFDEE